MEGNEEISTAGNQKTCIGITNETVETNDWVCRPGECQK